MCPICGRCLITIVAVFLSKEFSIGLNFDTVCHPAWNTPFVKRFLKCRPRQERIVENRGFITVSNLLEKEHKTPQNHNIFQGGRLHGPNLRSKSNSIDSKMAKPM